MINLSIIFLSYIGHQNAPFISITSLHKKKTNFFSNVNFQKSFSNFFFSSYNNFHTSLCTFKSSIFSNFLAQSIFIQQNVFLVNQIYELTKQDFDEDPVNIWDCIFRKFYLPEEYGAAFNTTNCIQLYNVYFLDIVSFGGSFYSEDIVTANYLTFEKVISKTSSCFISKTDHSHNTNKKSINLDNILIKNAIADQTFGFTNDNNNQTYFTNSNVTNCESKKLNGMLESYYSNSYIKFISFSFIKSPENSISISSFADKCQFTYCIFHSINFCQGVIKTINVVDVCLKFCFFQSSKYYQINKSKKSDRYQMIYTLNYTYFKIDNCCFDVNIEEISIFENNEINSNIYNNQKCLMNIMLTNKYNNNNLGYSYQRTPTYRALVAPTPTYDFVFANNRVNKSIGIDDLLNITFASLCILIIVIIFFASYNYCLFNFRHSQNLFNFKNSKEML